MRGEDAKEDDKLPEQQPRIVVFDAADGLAGTGKEGMGVFHYYLGKYKIIIHLCPIMQFTYNKRISAG